MKKIISSLANRYMGGLITMGLSSAALAGAGGPVGGAVGSAIGGFSTATILTVASIAVLAVGIGLGVGLSGNGDPNDEIAS